MLVYKYMTPEKVETMMNGHILASPILFLNDPWEFRIRFESSETELRRQAEMFHEELYNKSFRSINRVPKEMPEDYFQDFKRKVSTDESKAEMAKFYIEKMSKLHGIISLSSDPASRLMWAHYAQYHRGIAVGIDVEGDQAKGMSHLGPTFKVRYSSDPLVLKDTELDRVTELLCTKHTDWTYEQEWRIFKQLKPEDVDFLPSIINGNPATFYGARFKPQIVRHVVFGLNTDDTLKIKVQDWRAKVPKGSQSVRYSQARINQTTQAFEID